MIDIPVLMRFAYGANPKPLSTKKAVDLPLKRQHIRVATFLHVPDETKLLDGRNNGQFKSGVKVQNGVHTISFQLNLESRQALRIE